MEPLLASEKIKFSSELRRNQCCRQENSTEISGKTIYHEASSIKPKATFVINQFKTLQSQQ